MIMQAEISTRGEDSSWGDVTPITFLPSSFRSPPVGPQVTIVIHIYLHFLSLLLPRCHHVYIYIYCPYRFSRDGADIDMAPGLFLSLLEH